MGMKIKCIYCGRRILKRGKKQSPTEYEPFCSKKCLDEYEKDIGDIT